MQINLPYHTYELRSRPASPSRLVNCYPEQLPAGSKSPILLRRAPGIASWTTVGDGPIRAMYTAYIDFDSGGQRLLYVVSGENLYSVDADGNDTLIGAVGSSGRIDLASNVNTLVCVSQPRAFIWDGATFSEILDDDFVSRGAGDVEFLSNYMLFREPDTNRFFGSEFGDSSSYDSLDFGTASISPDELIGLLAHQQSLMLFGSDTIETWENTTISGFPFERNVNGTIEVGCLDPNTIGRVFNLVYWVADDYSVRRLEGISPMRVSTSAIEQKLSSETLRGAFAYEQDGHYFYCLSTDGGTYIHDLTTNEWHERQTYGAANWSPRTHAQFAGKELIGSSVDNKIGYLDHQTYQYWDTVQRMEWTYQPIYADGQRAFHDRFEVVLETGVGLSTGQGSDPKIMMQYSNDGGVSWRAAPDRSFGAVGKSEVRCVWHNLGSARERVYRCAVSDPVPVTVTNTLVEVRGGRL